MGMSILCEEISYMKISTEIRDQLGQATVALHS